MVYIQLLGDRALDPIIQYVKNQVDRDCCAHEPCPQFNLAHFLNLEFVSPEVITEMIQIAAESSSSRTPVHGLKNLERFLQIRAMHYNVPASRFTRRLVIYLNLQGLLKEYGLEHKSYFVENLQRLQDQLKSAFEAIPPRKDRRIDIQLDGYDLEEWELERGDILMKPCLSMLDERIARHEIAFVRVFRYNPNDPNGY
jgi:hypothetical protein